MTHPLANIELGDVVDVTGGGSHTVRAVVLLPGPAGSLIGFLILGEFESLLGLPLSVEEPVLVYQALDYIPEEVNTGRVAWEGAFNYWAAHLPAMQQAMGELKYRVILMRGKVDPAVIIYRGNEVIVFLRTGQREAREFSVLRMTRGIDASAPLTRHSSTVRPRPLVPLRAPDEVPAEVPSQSR